MAGYFAIPQTESYRNFIEGEKKHYASLYSKEQLSHICDESNFWNPQIVSGIPNRPIFKAKGLSLKNIILNSATPIITEGKETPVVKQLHVAPEDHYRFPDMGYQIAMKKGPNAVARDFWDSVKMKKTVSINEKKNEMYLINKETKTSKESVSDHKSDLSKTYVLKHAVRRLANNFDPISEEEKNNVANRFQRHLKNDQEKKVLVLKKVTFDDRLVRIIPISPRPANRKVLVDETIEKALEQKYEIENTPLFEKILGKEFMHSHVVQTPAYYYKTLVREQMEHGEEPEVPENPKWELDGLNEELFNDLGCLGEHLYDLTEKKSVTKKKEVKFNSYPITLRVKIEPREEEGAIGGPKWFGSQGINDFWLVEHLDSIQKDGCENTRLFEKVFRGPGLYEWGHSAQYDATLKIERLVKLIETGDEHVKEVRVLILQDTNEKLQRYLEDSFPMSEEEKALELSRKQTDAAFNKMEEKLVSLEAHMKIELEKAQERVEKWEKMSLPNPLSHYQVSLSDHKSPEPRRSEALAEPHTSVRQQHKEKKALVAQLRNTCVPQAHHPDVLNGIISEADSIAIANAPPSEAFLAWKHFVLNSK